MAGEFPPVEDLYAGAIDVRPVDRDWSEGWPETWDFIAAPDCGDCGTYARWVSGETLADEKLSDEQLENDPPDWAEETWDAWRCPKQECDRFGEEIEPEYDNGPMMNYAYPFPGSLDQEDANKISHLPLCIVNREDSNNSELVLTGGGMDLSWEICEAFMRLGYLPPAHFARVPAMSGRGKSERDKWIIAGCRQTAKLMVEFAQRDSQSILRELNQIENS